MSARLLFLTQTNIVTTGMKVKFVNCAIHNQLSNIHQLIPFSIKSSFPLTMEVEPYVYFLLIWKVNIKNIPHKLNNRFAVRGLLLLLWCLKHPFFVCYGFRFGFGVIQVFLLQTAIDLYCCLASQVVCGLIVCHRGSSYVQAYAFLSMRTTNFSSRSPVPLMCW